jgi:hypothetical protein
MSSARRGNVHYVFRFLFLTIYLGVPERVRTFGLFEGAKAMERKL